MDGTGGAAPDCRASCRMGALVASAAEPRRRQRLAGYFQMRVAVWNAGQRRLPAPRAAAQWFIDCDRSPVHLARGPIRSDETLGLLDRRRAVPPSIAALQLRLAEARELIGPACPGDPARPSVARAVAVLDTTAPVARSAAAATAPAAPRAMLVAVTCPAEACAAATGTLRLPGRATRCASARLCPRAGSDPDAAPCVERAARAAVGVRCGPIARCTPGCASPSPTPPANAREPLTRTVRLAPSVSVALDDLDPVAVRIAHEADARAALAHACRAASRARCPARPGSASVASRSEAVIAMWL